MITHKLLSSVVNKTSDSTGFDITTNCHSVMFDNNGSDDAKLYFNNDETNYYLLKSGSSLSIKSDVSGEYITDIVKVVFVTNTDPLINILKQTKEVVS